MAVAIDDEHSPGHRISGGAERIEAGGQGSDHCIRHSAEDTDGIGSAVGVKSTKYQMSGFSKTENRFGSLFVADFSNEDNIRIFAHSCSKRIRKRSSIVTDFPLRNQAFFRLKNKFNRIFYGNNIFSSGFIDMFEHSHE